MTFNVTRTEIPKKVVISGRRLSANDSAQAILELSLKRQERESLAHYAP